MAITLITGCGIDQMANKYQTTSFTTIPKTLARLVKTKAPITPPDESCGNKSPGK